jgi:hypothetical protein
MMQTCLPLCFWRIFYVFFTPNCASTLPLLDSMPKNKFWNQLDFYRIIRSMNWLVHVCKNAMSVFKSVRKAGCDSLSSNLLSKRLIDQVCQSSTMKVTRITIRRHLRIKRTRKDILRNEYKSTWTCLGTSHKGKGYVHCQVWCLDFSCAHGGLFYCKRHIERKAY